jgi:UDP-glucose 4-epimerase
MSRVALLGATGFVGTATAEALQARGANVVPVRAPRLTSDATSVAALQAELATPAGRAAVATLQSALEGCDAVVNAAGLAAATGHHRPELIGANALLPLAVARARPSGARLVHVSSAAVQGRRRVLDESTERAPFSPYSHSKALGELVLADHAGAVVFRPTSVHGVGRSTTRTLVRVLSSRAASVAGPGDGPTPQVLVQNVGDAIAFVTLSTEPPPDVVLQPWEQLSVAGLVRLLGDREPKHVPARPARLVVGASARLGALAGPLAGASRRLEMMWFGQDQLPGWLDARWSPPVGPSGWKELAP